jgi:lipopolysaccharide transport system permease protein
VTIIEPPKGWASFDVRSLWEYRELLAFFVWRDVKVRYKQTLLGGSWAILQPFMTMVVFSIFFGNYAGVPSDGVPYPVFSYAALVPWTLFATGLSTAATSLTRGSNLLRKIYFPRIVLPLSAVASSLVDFCIAFTLLVPMAWYFGLAPSLRLVLIPAFVLLALVSALGAGLWTSALNVQFRDVRQALPFLIQIWLFITPVIYPSSAIQGRLSWLYWLNPMAGVVDGFRWCVLGTSESPSIMLGVSCGAAVVLLVSGALYFRRTERYFADIV